MHFVTLLAETVDCQVLLEHGAKVNQVKNDGWTALHLAARYADAEMVKVCIPCTSLPRRRTASVDCQILLDYGADVNAVDDEDWTALHLAACYADAEMVKVCIGCNSLTYWQKLSTARFFLTMALK